ncbi:acyl-CoA dehydrogenase family protein [Jidongwangia harbinensis]|uniref:acyl-CoA dehydrogenase family protein n=1 Tax=Jidongwangia harbinensis TaxID=2878561 RepID=UPI001CDA3A8B|nr:acyl-CoA dehydrogenase family protein [Jidongwangia harbinensis]MCA2211347.1 hypothetical protein [Jidongwangia harbinensis]
MTPGGTARVAELERLLSDLWEAGGPLPYTAVLAADERAELCAEGRRLLHRAGFTAEFVPAALGGRLARLDELVAAARTVCRRDPTLALGHGLGSFLAAATVWTSGTADQRRRVAALVLAGGTVATVCPDLAHGDDPYRGTVTAHPDGTGNLRVSGRADAVPDGGRADALVLLADVGRPADADGAGLAHLLVDTATLPPGGVTRPARPATAGLRGLALGGVRFRDCPVPGSALLGTPGGGADAAARAAQVTRACLAGTLPGALDTGLRTVLRFATRRRLYGQGMDALPAVRAALADAFADLLILDAVGTVTARALHVLPEQAGAPASAALYTVGRRLTAAMDRLSRVLGAHSYLRDGEYGIFQKVRRDAALAVSGYAAPTTCLRTVLRYLPGLADRTPAGTPPPVAGQVYRDGAAVPELSFDRLTTRAGRVDALAGALHHGRRAAAGADPELHRLATAFCAELAGLGRQGARLRPPDLGPHARPEALALAARYATVLAASACLNVWAHRPRDGFLGDPAWAVAALHRLAGAAGLPAGAAPGPAAAYRPALYRELTDRFAGRRTFDLADRPPAG